MDRSAILRNSTMKDFSLSESLFKYCTPPVILTNMNFITDYFRYRNIPYLEVTTDKGSKEKPAIVLLHGLAASSKTWKPLLPLLDSDRNRIITLDLLGFGVSPKPQDIEYTVDQHVAAVHKTLKKLGINGSFILVGHSMGSIISVNYLTKYPKQVARAILVSLPLYLDDHQIDGKIAKTLNNQYLKAYQFFRENSNFTKSGAKALRKLFRVSDGIDITDSTWVSFNRSLKNTIEDQSVFKEIANTTIPITEIHGNFDEVVVSGNMKQLNKLKGVKVISVRGEDHEITKRFAKRIINEINRSK